MTEKELKLWLIEKYNMSNKKHIDFIIDYLNTQNGTKSYKKVYTGCTSDGAARVGAYRILKEYKVSLTDFLDLAGHDKLKIVEALDALFIVDPDKYLSHIEKLKKLDAQRLDVNINSLPVLNIISNEDEKN